MEREKDRGGSFGPGQALIYIANDAKPAVINLHNGCCARARASVPRSVRICLGGDWIGRSFRINDAVFQPSILSLSFSLSSSSLGRSMTRQSGKREGEGERERKE